MSETHALNPSRGRGRRLSDSQIGFLLVLPALILFAVIILYPLLGSMVMAFLDKSLVFPGEEFVGLENIQRALRRDFLPLLSTTMIFTVGATVLPFLIGFAVALILNGRVIARGFWRGMFLLPWLIPSVVVSFLWMWIFNANYGVINGMLRELGLVAENINFLGSRNTAMWSVIIAKTWNTFPWITVMVLAGLQTISRDLYEAAAIDGADRLRSFWNVTVPQLRGVISTVLLLSFIWNFQHLETIYVMTTGGPSESTTTFAIGVYKAAFQARDLGEAGAIGLLWMALLSVIVIVYLRFAVREDA
ncbi:MAG: sugar ABC transporter permease [Pleurocapsa minor GSE-CHR-MK-17-07R]|jgi:multiple sugar transport system permease protein|nr:sugar ABC transporter permease [Pleurocapsa minor GSE-CHR-MK 17-07R]